MSSSLRSLFLAGCVAAAGLTGCATSLPVTEKDRSLILTAKEVFPTLPERARNAEELEKQRWPDGSIDLTYSYRGRHDSVPVFIHSSIGSWPTAEDARIARSESDNDHRRLLFALEQRDSDTFVPVGPDARTSLLFAGMQPVGMSFSTQLGTETYTFICLSPPQFFNPHRTRDAIVERLERLRAAKR